MSYRPICFLQFGARRHAAGLVTGLFLAFAPHVVTPAVAQSTLRLAGDGAFRETLLDAPPPPARGMVTGVSVVGVRLDGPTHPFDPRTVRVLLGTSDKARDFLCVQFISRDGRYSAQARYKLVNGMGPDPVLETRTAYEKQLITYKSGDVAILARSAESCDDTKAVSFFAVDLGALPDGQLVVLVNGGDARVRAQLGQNNKPLSDPVICAPAIGDVRVGFTQECRLTLPPGQPPGAYQLSIGETASTGEIVVKTYDLAIYRGTAAK